MGLTWDEIERLQRGRAQLSAEGVEASEGYTGAEIASTGPRSIERGGSVAGIEQVLALLASTGPRSIERGGPLQNREQVLALGASTGPRSIERGGNGKFVRVTAVNPGFNGAALN